MPIQRAKPRFIDSKGTATADQLNIGQIGGRRNVVINGGFQCWQRATSITSSGFSADRWRSTTGSGGAMTVSRQSFTVGQTDVPNNPKYFFRHAQTTAFTNTGYNSDRTRIEDVKTLSGQTCTLSWYMKADASRTVRVNITQDFGSGGSPSADVETAIVSSQAITTSWAEYTVTFTMPSISGKTIGTNEDSFIELGFDYRAEVNNTFTIDIANVQLESGSVATPFETRSFGEELALCQRYFFQINGTGTDYATMGSGQMYQASTYLGEFKTPVPMRATPSFSLNNSLSTTNFMVVTSGYVRAISSLTPTGDNQYLRLNCATTTSGTQGHGAYIQLQSGYNALWSAEL